MKVQNWPWVPRLLCLTTTATSLVSGARFLPWLKLDVGICKYGCVTWWENQGKKLFQWKLQNKWFNRVLSALIDSLQQTRSIFLSVWNVHRPGLLHLIDYVTKYKWCFLMIEDLTGRVLQTQYMFLFSV